MFALLFMVVLVGCGWWAWGFQQRAVRILHVRPSRALHREHARRVGTDPPRRRRSASPAGDRAARVAVEQLERGASPTPSPVSSSAPLSAPLSALPSVLGWEAFSIVCTLVMDGTVLVGCLRRNDPQFRDRGHSLRPVAVEDSSIVLLIGHDERANQAVALLESWRASTATLRLRPTRVAGAIELFDGRANALRAGLLAA